MNTSPSLGWQRLDDVYYRLRECYAWTVPHETHALSKTSLAPITSTLLAQKEGSAYAYSSVGAPLAQLNWNAAKSGNLVSCEWSGDCREDVYFVSATGVIRQVYDYMNNNFRDFRISIDGCHILEVKHWEKGIVIRLSNRKFFALFYNQFLTDSVLPVEIDLSDSLQTADVIYGWTVMAGTDNSFELLIGKDRTVMTVQYNASLARWLVVDKALTEGPFRHISVSPNRKLVSLYNVETGKNYIVSSDLEQFYAEYTNNDEAPGAVAWCGSDAVILVYKEEIKLVGPSSEALTFYLNEEENLTFTVDTYSYEEYPLVRTECDGLKMFYKNKVSFLSRVGDASVDAFLIGSTSPAAILLDSSSSLHQQLTNNNSLFNLQETGTLEPAITDLVESARDEFGILWQKRLLKSIQLGRLYFDKDTTQTSALAAINDAYLETVTKLRILNQLRAREIGVYITYQQFQLLLDDHAAKLLGLLLKRNLHYLCLKLLMELRKINVSADRWFDTIVNHWFNLKIKQSNSASDQELYELIIAKLGQFSVQCQPFNGRKDVVMSLNEICDLAYREGRLTLCKQLLNHTAADRKYPLVITTDAQFVMKFLTNLEEHELVLLKLFPVLTDDGDSAIAYSYDLSLLSLYILQQKVTLPHFFKLLNLTQFNSNGSIISIANSSLISSFWVQNVGRKEAGMTGQSDVEKWYYQQDNKFELENERFETELKAIDPKVENSTVFREFSIEDVRASYEKRKQIYEAMVNEYSQSAYKSDTGYLKRELLLLDYTYDLSKTYQSDFIQYKTIIDVIKVLIGPTFNLPYSKLAKVQKQFKVNDQKLWYTILDTFTVQSNSFIKLHEFVVDHISMYSSNQPPIGFEPIIERCIVRGSHLNMEFYVSECKTLTYKQKIEIYLNVREYLKASTLAFENKNSALLLEIYETAMEDGQSNERTRTSIKRYVDQLKR
ncbi:hypothetical protein BABINDRAFT_161652 [Babjeviella inositovora NRRL Y-12698]|uniref:Probable vacuolar protein sorting-associated protein 16 homolog n=1 Tax=Babjeviella inositovora NRRL Y-12698 TaxID=984486 RepID=A0A1E3QR90_9ASCO|nr:uncharacterized protein BABINDRAFT_161652 [Babjeviella inositovora NRRL Y-12698]ODQ80004.1 hypothetical protein BABINDRAFT_161652 [Babjeviella inositovora NRRL Y-12698]